MKKTWTTPELVVLVRIQANEMVLGTCKSSYGLGPDKSAAGCEKKGPETCQTLNKS